MIRYGDMLDLWEFVWIWMVQVDPSQMEIIEVTSYFRSLRDAIRQDTGVVNFHHIATVRNREIGPATKLWLDLVRPHLAQKYIYFDHRIELLVNPTGRSSPPA